MEATTKGNFYVYIFGGFFLYVTIPQVSEGAISVFHHPTLKLEYSGVNPLCFAENSEPPGKHRCGPSRNLRKGLIEKEVPKELGWERICLQCRNPNSIPGLGRPSGERNGYPLQDSCLENSMDERVWWATVHGAQRVRHD